MNLGKIKTSLKAFLRYQFSQQQLPQQKYIAIKI